MNLDHDRLDQVCDPILIRSKVDQDQGYEGFDDMFKIFHTMIPSMIGSTKYGPNFEHPF